MTEEDWISLADPQPMLAYLRGSASDRKLRLFAVACCRSLGEELPGPHFHDAISLAEQFADGEASGDRLFNPWDLVSHPEKLPSQCQRSIAQAIHWTARMAQPAYESWTRDEPFDLPLWAERVSRSLIDAAQGDDRVRTSYALRAAERCAQADLIRDIFGNPLQPETIDPRWLTTNVVDLSRLIYSERLFDRMPILSDALMDAGCDAEAILQHCRSGLPHTRGCWVVDLLTGKK